MKLNRRGALGALGLAASGCATVPEGADVVAVEFRHGVASGDPATDSVVLWTAVTLPVDATASRLPIRAEVSSSADFASPRDLGRAEVRAADGWTFKTIASGLKPGTDYWYRFRCGDAVSPVGRTRTLPETTSTAPVTWAVVSCALFPTGFFNAYDAVSKLERLDAVICLGDYIYEYGAGEREYGMATGLRIGRIPEPAHEIVTLDDYRTRFAQARREPELQAAHARAPWIVAFDDHEITNDPWMDGAQNHQPETEGDWATRKAAALKAWFEWMPIRDPAPGGDLVRASYRSFRFGKSASLHMLESRLTARSRQLDYETDLDPNDIPAFRARLNDPARRLLGDAQLDWLESETRASVRDGCAWQVLGNQVFMTRMSGPRADGMTPEGLAAAIAAAPEYRRAELPLLLDLYRQGLPLNLDTWDGYPAERERLYERLRAAGARPVVITGDSHTFLVNSLSDAEGRFVGPEFGTTAVSSPPSSTRNFLPGVDVAALLVEQNAEVDHVDFVPRGFTLLTLTPERASADLIGLSTVESREYEARSVGTWVSRALAEGGSARPMRV